MNRFEQNPARATLQILATSDVHGVISPKDSGSAPVGLSNLATLIRDARRDHPNCLLFDNGDFLQGTAICDHAAENQHDGTPHPVIKAMNLLDYDAVGLGNHEFDYGLPFLIKSLSEASFPVVATNMRCLGQNWVPSIMLQRQIRDQAGAHHDLKIGVISLLPEQVVEWNARHLSQKATTVDIVGTAVSASKVLRNQGANLIICLLHSGLGADKRRPKMENAAIPVAQLADIDALICGHTHRQLPDPKQLSTPAVNFQTGHIHAIPTVMPGFNGSFLGKIKLELLVRDGTFTVVKSRTQLLSSSNAEPDTEMQQQVAPYMADCMANLRTPIGHIQSPIHSYFSRLPGDPAVTLTAQAQLHYAQRHLIDRLPQDVPILSAASPFKAGGRGGPKNFVHIPCGPFTKADLTSLHPFQNTLTALQMTGHQLRNWLEMSASNFNQICVGDASLNLRNPEFPCYGFDTVFGVTYEIDVTQSAKYNVLGDQISDGQRIQNLLWRGMPVSDTQPFVFLTNSYRAGGGGFFPGATELDPHPIPMVDCRAMIEGYVKDCDTDVAHFESPWCFKKVAGLSASTQIGPGILELIGDSVTLPAGLELGELNAAGFLDAHLDLSPRPSTPSLAIPKRSAYMHG